MFVIKTEKREKGADLEVLRKEGMIPAVFYGAGKESASISVPVLEFKKIWKEAGESSTIKLSSGQENVDVLIHEVQVHPVSGEPLHIDFLVIDMNKKIKVKVPLEFVGISDAVKNGLGNLVKVLHEVEIEALPKDLPHNLEADISKLAAVDSQVFVSDIALPTGVEMVTAGDEVVASIVLQKEEKEEVAEPADLSAIEVEKKGKKEEEGGEAPKEESEEKPRP